MVSIANDIKEVVNIIKTVRRIILIIRVSKITFNYLAAI